MAAYRALYRKWRPTRFEDVVSQQSIVTALQNQICAGRVGHAYLFTGTRGTGKTTCAKIFAKAVNCIHPNHGDPCGECEICRGVEDGSIMDVVEIDAASNNGVDNIRDLREETAYTPSLCRYKVYIIHEVHMLPQAAFNALLKIMEEPPAHIIFILATTEIHKVPATIRSRCQRYDFGRIQPSDIAKRLEYVAEQENIALTSQAAQLIGRLADGALRDALSILDTCASVSSEVDEPLVRQMAGVTDRNYLFSISGAVKNQQTVEALKEIADLRQKSVDLRRLTEELIAQIYDLPQESVKILGQQERKTLGPELIFRTQSEGVMTHLGSFASFVGGLRAAENAAAGENLATMVQTAAVVFSCVVSLALTVSGGLISLALPAALLYQASWTVLQLAMPLSKQY